MLNITKFQSQYKSFVEFVGNNITDLFSEVIITDHCKNCPPQWSTKLWVNIEGVFSGKSVYVIPSHELSELISQCSIFGRAQYGDVYLNIGLFNDQYKLGFKYQQIIGGRQLIDLTDDQYKQLKDLLGE